MYNIDNRPVFHSRVSTVAGKVQEEVVVLIIVANIVVIRCKVLFFPP